MVRILDRFLLLGLLAALSLSPWMFGSVEPWAVHGLTLWLLLLLALWGVKAALQGSMRVHVTPIHGVLLGALLVAGWQVHRASVSIPDPIEGVASAVKGPAEGSEPEASVSARGTEDPPSTRRAIARLAMLLGYFGLSIELVRGSRRYAGALLALMGSGFLLALLGMIHKLSGSTRLLWMREVEAPGIAFGPFVNRNHAAGFLEMLFPLPLALILARGVPRERWGICGVLALVLGTALVVTGSRGGMLVLGVQLLLLPLLWGMMNAGEKRRFRFGVTVAMLVGAGIALGAWWIGAEPIVSRWRMSAPSTIEDRSEAVGDVEAALTGPLNRPMIWKATWQMIRDHLWWGVGLGAYPVAYTQYDRSAGLSRVEQAHNDYLQLVAELGIWGGILLAVFLLAMSRTIRRVLRLAPYASWERALGLGATLAVVGVGVHSVFDFNLQVTSNALLFLFWVALLENLGAERHRLVKSCAERGL